MDCVSVFEQLTMAATGRSLKKNRSWASFIHEMETPAVTNVNIELLKGGQAPGVGARTARIIIMIIQTKGVPCLWNK